MLKKYTCLLIGIALLLSPTAWAETERPQTAFREKAVLPSNTFVVPTIVEVPFLGDGFNQQLFLVIEQGSGQIVPHYWRSKVSELKTPLRVSANGRVYPALSDSNTLTSENFAVSGTGREVLYLDIQSAQGFEASEIVFTFDRNVTPPSMVTVYAVTEENTQEVILARTNFSGTRVPIPKVSTKTLQVVLEYYQPLRIIEIGLVEEDKAIDVSQGLRFLAVPNRSYEIFLNPDRPVFVSQRESGNLRSDTGVVVLTAPIIEPHREYQQSDRDSDGLPDVNDNCPDHENANQEDVDGNGTGDACDDFDRDSVVNSLDNCRDQPNRDQKDEDADGIGDVCDDEESRITEQYQWALWVVMGLAGAIIVGLFVLVARRDPALAAPDSEENQVS